MKDDELEVWRRQWHAQPAVPIDLIRKVERQTVYMRLDWIPQILPALIGVGTVIGAVITRDLRWILLAGGTWAFLALAWLFMVKNKKGVWAPAAETTAAYVDLSIERCRRRLNEIRFGNVMMVLLTVFVLVADYEILRGEGKLATTSEQLAVALAFSIAILIVAFILVFQVRKRRKTKAELAYLLNLQRQLGDNG